jgi:GMP synthase (glutamine-hydrolysing)
MSHNSRVVLVRHELDPDDNRVVTFLRDNGIEPEIVRPYRGEKLAQVDSSVVASCVFGGPFNVYEEEKHPYLSEEHRWIEQCIKNDVPLLGICQGAQSIARVLGAYAGPLSDERCEFGYYEITATDAGKKYFPEKLVVTESHYHEFHIPDGGELLAYSELFGQQAMRYGNSTFAFQFHAEATPTEFKRWQSRHPENFARRGAQSLGEQNKLMLEYDKPQHNWFISFLDGFLKDAVVACASS